MRYLLVGNYGVGNAGDEVLRGYFLERYPEVSWHVLSARPQVHEYPRFPAGIRSLLSFRWLKTIPALLHSDGMVFGGGSLFTDAETLFACFVWFSHVLFALLFRKPYFLAFQGIGPFRTGIAAATARFVVRHASYVSVRDTASAERMLPWKKNTEVIQTFDPSISLLKDQCDINRTKKLFVFIPRFSTGWTSEILEKFIRIFREMQQAGAEIRIISMQPYNPSERRLTEKLAHALAIPVHEALVMEEVVRKIEGATCVITERYHGIIAAALACGVPFIALKLREQDKLDALARMCGCPSETLRSFQESVLADRDWIHERERLVSLCAQYSKLVEQGEETLKEALKRFAKK